MRKLLLIAVAVTSQAVMAAGGIYSWTDETGALMFGDSPPDNVVAKPVDPPKLTVLEGFSQRYQQSGTDASAPETDNDSEKEAEPEVKKSLYTSLDIIAPKNGQAIRANDGDVSVALGISPKLRAGDKLVVTLDGVEVSRGTSRVINLPNLDRGEHRLMVSVVNTAKRTLISSEPLTFNVLRHSILQKKPFNAFEK